MFDNVNKKESFTKDIATRHFASIDSKEEASDAIIGVAKGFLLFSVVLLVLSFVIWPFTLIDAIIYAILAACLWAFKSRIVAILLTVVSGIVFITTLLNIAGITDSGGRNILVAVFALGLPSVRFKQHSHFTSSQINSKPSNTSLQRTAPATLQTRRLQKAKPVLILR